MDKVWYNRALVYYHNVPDKGWTNEFAFCRKESGIIKPHIKHDSTPDGNLGNI